MKAQIEQIPSSTRQSFVCRRFEEPRFDHPFHFHPEIEIAFVEHSRGSMAVGDHLGSFAEEELYVLGSNLPHIFRNTVETTGGAVSEVLHFSPDVAGGFITRTPEMAPFAQLIRRADLGLRFTGGTACSAGELLPRLRKSEGPDRWQYFMQLASILSKDNTPETLGSRGYAMPSLPAGSERMQRACQIIFERFDEDLSHEQLAAELNLTTAYFSRQFKRATRRTYTDFLGEVRLGHACRLLLETHRAIVDIAFDSGFRNLSNFNRRFLRTYGCSPREYRKRHAQRPS